VQDLVIRNNICSQNLTYQILLEHPVQNLVVDYNLIDGYRGYEGETLGTNYKEGDPEFVDPAGSDFHLQGDSPAVDNGSSIDAPGDDFDGNRRPQGEGYDIGAYEFLSTACPDCSGDPALLTNVTFISGTSCECVNATSITIGPGVTVEAGATVVFKAPKVIILNGTHFKNGSVVNIVHN